MLKSKIISGGGRKIEKDWGLYEFTVYIIFHYDKFISEVALKKMI